MKPWLEEWHVSGGMSKERLFAQIRNASNELVAGVEDFEAESLLSAAPDMCRALLVIEWNGMAYGNTACCPACGNIWEGEGSQPRETHADACKVDIALTKSGLPDQASRDAARKELGL